MWSRWVIALTLLAGCLSSSSGQVQRTRRYDFALRGEVGTTSDADLVVLQLDGDACVEIVVTRTADRQVFNERLPCAPPPWGQTALETPWGETIAATQLGNDGAAFRIDWADARVDPLDPAVDELLSRPWTLRSSGAGTPLRWAPSPAVRARMVRAAATAKDIDLTVGELVAPPLLVVVEFRPVEPLRFGDPGALELTVRNEGKGDAYRVTALTRSTVPALHGLRFSYGRLRPGETKIRRVPVELPRDGNETDALVVLEFSEAHRFAPANASRRFAVLPASDEPDLQLACHLPGSRLAPPKADAGQTVHLTCTVSNRGATARGVVVSVRVGTVVLPAPRRPFDLAGDGSVDVVLPFEVPRDAQLDTRLPIAVVARPDNGGEREVVLELIVARPKICPDGKLTRAEFAKKRAKLREARDKGLIAQEDYDRYEAELVGCLE